MNICAFGPCEKSAKCAGLCHGHYSQKSRGRELSPLRVPASKCNFEGCDKPHLCKGWCNAHYMQKFRGEELRTLQEPKYDCSFDGCGRPHQAKGYCSRHYQQTLLGQEPSQINDYRADSVSYGALHTRIRTGRGSAADYPCVECGDKAFEWAYDHQCPSEKISKLGSPYSTDIYRYKPMCRSCHKTFDHNVGRVPA